MCFCISRLGWDLERGMSVETNEEFPMLIQLLCTDLRCTGCDDTAFLRLLDWRGDANSGSSDRYHAASEQLEFWAIATVVAEFVD